MTVRQCLVAQNAHFDVAPIIIDGVSYLRYDLWSPAVICNENKVVYCGKKFHDIFMLTSADDNEIVEVLKKPEAENEDYDPYVEDAKAWEKATGIPEIDVREFYGMDKELFNKLIEEFIEDRKDIVEIT